MIRDILVLEDEDVILMPIFIRAEPAIWEGVQKIMNI